MRTFIITNIDNEHVEITANELDTFIDVVTFDDNLMKCEIYFPGSGWEYLANVLEEIEQKKVEDIEDIDGCLENYFENHLFDEEHFLNPDEIKR